MIFEPQPLEFFKGYEAPPRISSLREKVEYLLSWVSTILLLPNLIINSAV
jgi:FAD synthase